MTDAAPDHFPRYVCVCVCMTFALCPCVCVTFALCPQLFPLRNQQPATTMNAEKNLKNLAAWKAAGLIPDAVHAQAVQELMGVRAASPPFAALGAPFPAECRCRERATSPHHELLRRCNASASQMNVPAWVTAAATTLPAPAAAAAAEGKALTVMRASFMAVRTVRHAARTATAPPHHHAILNCGIVDQHHH